MIGLWGESVFEQAIGASKYFDLAGRPEAETLAAFRDLNRLNVAFQFSRPFEVTVPGWLGPERCKRLEILDVGAGTGLLGKQLSEWARSRGWDWRFTNLDENALALQFGGAPRTVVGSVLALPFDDGSFDLVTASQMTHHLSDDEVVTHLREAWRVSRDGVFVSDLHRNPAMLALLWFSTRWLRIGRHVRQDAVVSVMRGFRVGELRDRASRAGVINAKVWVYYGTRILLRARKATG